MSQKIITIGEYLSDEQRPPPLSRIMLQVIPLDLVMQWGRCGQTADYLATFFAYHFEHIDRALNTLSTVINELVENCVKFSANKRLPVQISASHFGEIVTIETTNRSHSTQVETFTTFMDRLLLEDAAVLFLARIELNALLDSDTSGLGLITVKKDFLSGIGVQVRFLPGSELHDVSVQVHLHAEMIEQ